MQDITDPTQRTVVSYALTKVGYPYSQQYRDTGNYYDCSSLAYYSWKAAGIDISYGGANTAAAEAEGLDSAGHTVSYDDMQPGDLIFYSYERNGRYRKWNGGRSKRCCLWRNLQCSTECGKHCADWQTTVKEYLKIASDRAYVLSDVFG